MIDIFDPEGSSKYPYTAAVEEYLGGVGRLVFPDGTVQFAEAETYPEIVYSPRMTEDELEAFCKEHFDKYETYFETHEYTLERGEIPPPIERFWEHI